MNMHKTFPQIFQVEHNKSFEVQNCEFYSYGEEYNTTCEQDDAIEEAVLQHDSLVERNKQLVDILTQARDFIAGDINCGPCGLGLICLIDDVLESNDNAIK